MSRLPSGPVVHRSRRTAILGGLCLALCPGTAAAETVDTTGTTVTYDANGGTLNVLSKTWTGNGTLDFDGPGLIGLDNSGGGYRNYFNMTGGLITLTGGVTLQNGGWQGGDWTSNKASMNIGPAATLDLWDGLAVRVDALTGGGNVNIGLENAGTRDLVVGVNNGSGTFGGRFYNGSGVVKLTKEGTGTQVLACIGEHSGGNYVTGGTLAGANPAAFGSGSIVLQGGNVEFRPQRGLTLTELGGSFNKDSYTPSSTIDSGFFSVHSTTAGVGHFPDNTTRAYAGQIYLAAGNWSFAENFDDGVFLKIGSTTLLDDNNWNVVDNGTINIATSGWYDIDLRVGQGTGGVGPSGGDNWTRGIGVGMVNTSTTSTNANDYQSFGLGVLGSNLRPSSSDTTTYTISNNLDVNQAGSLSVTESGLTVTASGAFSGSGALTKSGPGTLILAGNNVGFGGNIVIDGGTLAASGGGSNFGGQNNASRTITINAGGTLDFRRGDVFGGHQTTNIPDIIINSGGTVTNKSGANVNALNHVILNGGTLTAEAGFGTAGLMAWSLNGNITSTGSSTISDNPSDANSGINMETNPTIDVQSGTLNLSARLSDKAFGNGASGITKQGSGTLVLSGTNTYTGETVIGGGILNVASLSDYGVASAIGARTAAQENSNEDGVGLHFKGGTLQYTGSTAQSTNRQIRILNGSTGATIDASGTNPNATLSFTYSGANTNLFDSPGTRTLTLTGSNTGTNVFALQLTDQSGNATSLAKTGGGTWVLSGASTYTGATTVSAGRLVMGDASTDAFATSGVTVASGATMGGSGTISGGTLDVSGMHAPGNSIGLQTVHNVNYNSNSIFEWEMDYGASPGVGTRGTNYDAVNVNGQITGPGGAVFRIVLPGSGTFSDTFWANSLAWSDIFSGSDSSVSTWTNRFSSGTLAFFNANGTITSPNPDTQGYFTLNGSTLNWTPVPELSNLLAGVLLGAGLLRRRRP